eukprot:TRINITY_DN22644_c0_g1_i11.p1 TRINITY_DN22644_c0_g1~~TRINITY_DN22644_c0_g1_i11.p1  ORF type:complete len:146 (+),score=21.55 TRINITY_DN22644_c0_g1_i11:95-532(+)
MLTALHEVDQKRRRQRDRAEAVIAQQLQTGEMLQLDGHGATQNILHGWSRPSRLYQTAHGSSADQHIKELDRSMVFHEMLIDLEVQEHQLSCSHHQRLWAASSFRQVRPGQGRRTMPACDQQDRERAHSNWVATSSFQAPPRSPT